MLLFSLNVSTWAEPPIITPCPAQTFVSLSVVGSIPPRRFTSSPAIKSLVTRIWWSAWISMIESPSKYSMVSPKKPAFASLCSTSFPPASKIPFISASFWEVMVILESTLEVTTFALPGNLNPISLSLAPPCKSIALLALMVPPISTVSPLWVIVSPPIKSSLLE